MNRQMQHSIKVLKGMTRRFMNPITQDSPAWRPYLPEIPSSAPPEWQAQEVTVAKELSPGNQRRFNEWFGPTYREQDGNPAYVLEKIQREISIADALAPHKLHT